MKEDSVKKNSTRLLPASGSPLISAGVKRSELLKKERGSSSALSFERYERCGAE
jgi:hypothetical protein